jgi:hypothetical protein
MFVVKLRLCCTFKLFLLFGLARLIFICTWYLVPVPRSVYVTYSATSFLLENRIALPCLAAAHLYNSVK